MRWLTALLLIVSIQAIPAKPQGDQTPASFQIIDVFIDSAGKPLGAYQLDFHATSGDVRIAGIEGGAVPAFAEPPFYDPKAMQREQVILAAFSLDEAETLPVERTRVATIHLQVLGRSAPEFEIRLQAAADAAGSNIAAEASFEERITR
jgi:hypothetical protein